MKLFKLLISMTLISCSTPSHNQASKDSINKRSLASKTTVIEKQIMSTMCREGENTHEAVDMLSKQLHKGVIGDIIKGEESYILEINVDDIIDFSGITIVPNGDKIRACLMVRSKKARKYKI